MSPKGRPLVLSVKKQKKYNHAKGKKVTSFDKKEFRIENSQCEIPDGERSIDNDEKVLELFVNILLISGYTIKYILMISICIGITGRVCLFLYRNGNSSPITASLAFFSKPAFTFFLGMLILHEAILFTMIISVLLVF